MSNLSFSHSVFNRVTLQTGKNQCLFGKGLSHLFSIFQSSLPLAKLCAMITMQKRGEASVQTFSFPLTQILGVSPDNNNDAKAKPQDTGLIDITVHYKSQVLQVRELFLLQS